MTTTIVGKEPLPPPVKGGPSWPRRILLGCAALVLLYCTVQVADFVWFRIAIPIGFQGANWSGEWRTRQYFGMRGRLVVRLPDPLPEDEDFKVEALVYYPIYSAWRTGQFVKMDFTGRYSRDLPSSGGQTHVSHLPADKFAEKFGGGKLHFKGSSGGQTVEYSALIDPTTTRIVGGYLSEGPYDYGHFMLRNP